jgi:tetratricopeptide (TPR) repeat protein
MLPTVLSVPNPYRAGPPVAGEHFYGRSTLISRLRDALYTTDVVLLQGQRRIGKTSFLRQFATFVRSVDSSLEPVVFDIQPYLQATLPQFQYYLARAIARPLEIAPPTLEALEASPEFEFIQNWMPQVRARLGDNRPLRELGWKRGEAALPPQFLEQSNEMVVLVDEFDNLDGQVVPQAAQVLLPFLADLVEDEGLKWVLATGRRSGKLPIDYERITGEAKELSISFLSQAETHTLITQPAAGLLQFEPAALDAIYDLTSGQPHLTQALCAEIFLAAQEQDYDLVTPDLVRAAVPLTLESYGGAIASIVQVPLVEERVLAAVARLAVDGRMADRDDLIELLLENNVRLNQDELNNALQGLLDLELLKGDRKATKIAVKLMQFWIRRNLFVEPNRLEEINIQRVLADSRLELANKAKAFGQYDIAIREYEEILIGIPNHPEALQVLPGLYKTTNNTAKRVKALKKLDSHDVIMKEQLIEALKQYASESKTAGNLETLIQCYQGLLELENITKWRRLLSECLLEKLGFQYDKIHENLLETNFGRPPNDLLYPSGTRLFFLAVKKIILLTQICIYEYIENKRVFMPIKVSDGNLVVTRGAKEFMRKINKFIAVEFFKDKDVEKFKLQIQKKCQDFFKTSNCIRDIMKFQPSDDGTTDAELMDEVNILESDIRTHFACTEIFYLEHQNTLVRFLCYIPNQREEIRRIFWNSHLTPEEFYGHERYLIVGDFFLPYLYTVPVIVVSIFPLLLVALYVLILSLSVLLPVDVTQASSSFSDTLIRILVLFPVAFIYGIAISIISDVIVFLIAQLFFPIFHFCFKIIIRLEKKLGCIYD